VNRVKKSINLDLLHLCIDLSLFIQTTTVNLKYSQFPKNAASHMQVVTKNNKNACGSF